MIQKENPQSKVWIDEKKMDIPYNRVHKHEIFKEKAAGKILAEAVKLNKALSAFKELCADLCEKAYQKDLGAGKTSTKGGYTLYCFDRSVKVERSLNENITFDENLIGAAKEKFDSFLKDGTVGVDEMVRQLIMDAFSSNKKGKLDSKKIMGLLSYKERISVKKYPAYHEALDLIQQSIRRPDSKTYYRIWQKPEGGQYESIDLNFSNI